MDCLENESVCSVKKENNLGYYRIHTLWNNNGFRINITSRDGAWTGEMTPENIQRISRELKVDPDKYLADCKEVLTTDDGKKGYFYAVENGSFTWKKMIDEDSGMKIRMGSVMVQPISFVDTIQSIVEVALNCKKNLIKELNSYKQEKEGNLQRIYQLQEKLEKLCDEKIHMESDLYNKFLLVLNSKKRKIQELEAREGQNAKKRVQELRSSNNSMKNTMEEINLVEAYELDTEDEGDCNEFGNEELVHKKSASAMEMSNNLEGVRDKCFSDEQNEKGYSTSEVEVGVKENTKCSNEKPDIKVTCGNSSILGTSNVNITSSDSKSGTDLNKSFPATKADILDFFFGPS